MAEECKARKRHKVSHFFRPLPPPQPQPPSAAGTVEEPIVVDEDGEGAAMAGTLPCPTPPAPHAPHARGGSASPAAGEHHRHPQQSPAAQQSASPTPPASNGRTTAPTTASPSPSPSPFATPSSARQQRPERRVSVASASPSTPGGRGRRSPFSPLSRPQSPFSTPTHTTTGAEGAADGPAWGALIKGSPADQRRWNQRSYSISYTPVFGDTRLPGMGSFAWSFHGNHASMFGGARPPAEAGGRNYSGNFTLMAGFVLGRLGPCTTAAEAVRLRAFLALPEASRFQWLRVYHSSTAQGLQRATVRRSSNINGDLIAEVRVLLRGGFCHPVDADTIAAHRAEALALLSTAELTRLGAKCGVHLRGAERTRQRLTELLSSPLRKRQTTLGAKRGQLVSRALPVDVALAKLFASLSEPVFRLDADMAALVYRVTIAFFAAHGYSAEDAVALMCTDMGRMRFGRAPRAQEAPQPHGAEGATDLSAGESEYGRVEDGAALLDAAVEALRVSDDLEWATTTGQADMAYGAMHRASSVVMDAGPGAPALALATHARTVLRGVNLLERERRYGDAVHYLGILLGCAPLAQSPHRPAFHYRTIMNLLHLKRKRAALEACEAALQDPAIAGGDRLQLERRCVSLAVPPLRYRRPRFADRGPGEERRLTLTYVGNVEEAVLTHYATEGWSGMHSENGFFLTLFGLLFWDTIFADVPGAFVSSGLQDRPRDWATPQFYAARRDRLDARLAEVLSGETRRLLAERWAASHGTLCVGVNWNRLGLQDLTRVAVGFSPQCLHAVCLRLAQDYRCWSHGLPDLLLWRPEAGRVDGAEGVLEDGGLRAGGAGGGGGGGPRPESRLVEVKGPGDSLSNNQRAWIDALAQAGTQIETCYVAKAAG